MNKQTVGIIGCGNMGGALGQGVLQAEELRGTYAVKAFARSPEKQDKMRAMGAEVFGSALKTADLSDFLIIAVKPGQVEPVLQEIAPALTPKKVVISVAAGVPVAQLQQAVQNRCPVVRVMPNTLVAVGKGLFGLCFDDPGITEEQKKQITALFAALGKTFTLPEKMFNAFSAYAGCGPAYVFYFAEALIEAGVTLGLDRSSARSIALDLLQGSACLAEQTGKHVSVLREDVSSPGGMTIAATNHMDARAVRAAIIEAMAVADARAAAMEKK